MESGRVAVGRYVDMVQVVRGRVAAVPHGSPALTSAFHVPDVLPPDDVMHAELLMLGFDQGGDLVAVRNGCGTAVVRECAS
jgi:hypothetical protein